MDEYRRRRLQTLLDLARNPDQECIAREYISRAYGYIDGLLEGNALEPTEYAAVFDEIRLAEAFITSRNFSRIGIVA